MSEHYEFFGKMWEHDDPKMRLVWHTTQRGHMDRQVRGFMELVDNMMNNRLKTPVTPEDLQRRIDALNWRIDYISQYAQAVYRARQKT
jgi:hypothetical protein